MAKLNVAALAQCGFESDKGLLEQLRDDGTARVELAVYFCGPRVVMEAELDGAAPSRIVDWLKSGEPESACDKERLRQ